MGLDHKIIDEGRCFKVFEELSFYNENESADYDDVFKNADQSWHCLGLLACC